MVVAMDMGFVTAFAFNHRPAMNGVTIIIHEVPSAIYIQRRATFGAQNFIHFLFLLFLYFIVKFTIITAVATSHIVGGCLPIVGAF
jgi:hypothetical protein